MKTKQILTMNKVPSLSFICCCTLIFFKNQKRTSIMGFKTEPQRNLNDEWQRKRYVNKIGKSPLKCKRENDVLKVFIFSFVGVVVVI